MSVVSESPGPSSQVPKSAAASSSVSVAFAHRIKTQLLQYLNRWESIFLDRSHAIIGIAMTRILIGVVGLGLLASNFTTRLYSFGPGSAWSNEHTDPQSDLSAMPVLALFRDASLNASLYTVLYVALMALAVLVILGWRTRAILFIYGTLWVSFIEANDLLGDQGDNMYRIILIMLLFTQSSAALSLDARRRRKAVDVARRAWGRGKSTTSRELSNLLHNLALVVLACQVFFVYVSGALYKSGGIPWQNGTAIYDPLATDRFGSWPWISELLTANASVVAVLTWSSVLLQLAFPFMLLSAPTRRLALVGIWCFHMGIGVVMGLPWFSLTMIAVDFIFVRDVSWLALNQRIRTAARHVRWRIVAE